MIRVLLIVISLSITTVATISASEESLSSRRERKLESYIERLNRSLVQYETELSELRSGRLVESVELDQMADSVVIAPSVEEEQVALSVILEDTTISFNPLVMDSLLCLWREKSGADYYNNFFQQYISSDEVGELPVTSKRKEDIDMVDSIYLARLAKLASPIRLSYNSIVKGYINRYVNPKYTHIGRVISRSRYYFPSIEEELVKRNLPVELRALAIVESALLPNAVSHAGAAGLWQFMPSTGKMYDLEINSLVDERRDPVRSTIAACEFINDLYNMYGDWTLAIAAYNCGPGNVNKALARSGLKNGTFWDIYHFLPSETRGYVPAFIAASYAYAYHKEHGIEVESTVLPLATDTVEINRIMHFGQVSKALELPIEVIRELNPQYRRDIVPATTRTYSLRLPQRFISPFIENESEIHKRDTLFLKQYIYPANIEKLRATPAGTIYVVRSGDTLSGIAKRYRVSTRQLMQWNNLKSAHRLSIGQKLKVSNN
ncbi:MAG: transglycosylase SLT domain-containing protein [Rikenellaceae bacterium]